MDLALRGRVALIAGTAEGIGTAITRAFAAEGRRLDISAQAAIDRRAADDTLRLPVDGGWAML